MGQAYINMDKGVIIVFSLVLSYLLGSIPFAVIVARMKGIAIREVGTRNPGAANVYRSVGKVYGIAVWLADTLKGVLAMTLTRSMLGLPLFQRLEGESLLWVATSGAVAIAGHCWSIFMHFKGGKGVSTLGGSIIYLMPKVFPLATVFYFLTQRTGRNPFAIVGTFLIFLLTCFLLYRDKWVGVFGSLGILLIISILANVSTIQEILEEQKKMSRTNEHKS